MSVAGVVDSPAGAMDVAAARSPPEDEEAEEIVMELNFREKGVSVLPSHVLRHSFLHFLDVSHNSLSELPAAIGDLPHL